MKTDKKFGEVYRFEEELNYSDERVAFKSLFETSNGGVAFVAMKAGQKLDTHTAPYEVMVTVCEGEVDFTMLDMTHSIKTGEFLLMGSNVAHSVVAKSDSKLMLVKIKE